MSQQAYLFLQEYSAKAKKLPESDLKEPLLIAIESLTNKLGRPRSPDTVSQLPGLETSTLTEEVFTSDDYDTRILGIYDDFSGGLESTIVGAYNEFSQSAIDENKTNSRQTSKMSATEKSMLTCIKYMLRLASNQYYLENVENNELQVLMDYFKLNEYISMLGTFEDIFAELDAARAKQYFNGNPDAIYAGKSAGLLFSYVRFDNDNIVRRKYELGRGSFGRAKSSTEINGVTDGAIKSQEVSSVVNSRFNDVQRAAYGILKIEFEKNRLISEPDSPEQGLDDVLNLIKIRDKFNKKQFASILEEHFMLPRLQMEASINQDLSIALSALAIRRDDDGSIYKVYQNMRNLGDPLLNKLSAEPSLEQRLSHAIDLLLHVDDLHSGRLSKTNTKYIHGDIKPSNILIDSNDELSLVDYGFGRSKGLSLPNHSSFGTISYLPIDYEDLNKPFDRQLVKKTPSYFFNDKISSLRSVFHAQRGTGILTSEQFMNLPEPIARLLDTSKIERCIQNNDAHTLRAISAALILYKQSPRACTQRNIDNLLRNKHLQDRIIDIHQQRKPKHTEITTNNQHLNSSLPKCQPEEEDNIEADTSKMFKGR